jgi:antitoxin component YwqK of YwqJK toxin-antitoxin module
MKKFLIISLLFLVLSCEQKENVSRYKNKRNNISIKYFPDGGIDSEVPYKLVNGDTIIHGLAKLYYPNGKVKVEVFYKNGKKEGIQKGYYDSGSLEYIGKNKNGVHDCVWIYYHLNGNLKEYANWVEGKQFGLAKWYNESGQIRTMNIIDFWGEVIYVISYDELGKKTQEDGVVFSPYYWYVPHRDSMPKDGKTFIQIAVSELPETKTTILMGEIGKKLKQLSVKDYIVTYQDTFTKVGKKH